MRRQRRPIFLGVLCTGLSALLYTGLIWLTGRATDIIASIVNAGGAHLAKVNAEIIDTALGKLLFVCLTVVALFSVRYFLTRGQIYFLSEASNRLSAHLRRQLFSKLLRLPVSYFNSRRTGSIQSVLTNDVNVYQNAISLIRDSIEGPIKAIGAFMWLLYIQPFLGTIAMLLIPVMVAILGRNSRRMRHAQMVVQEDLAMLSGQTQEKLQGARIVKAFGVEKQADAEYDVLIEQSYQSQMSATRVMASLRPLVEVIGAVALAIIFYISGHLAAKGLLTVGNVTALALAMDMINQGFKTFAGISNTMATVQAATDRIYTEVLNVPEEPLQLAGTKQLSHPKGEIRFENVGFVYPDGTRALSNVSFRLPAGSSLALVGPSGAGKSTIADLILRFYDPTEGRIFLDDVDILELSITDLRSHIGVVPQHTFLFVGSIEDNVRLGRESATDAEVAEALEAAHATEFVKEMNSRETSELGERGVRLSGGQMQRVAIARAIVRKPKIFVLDEATAALDATSERIVHEALEEVMHDRTTLMIAHRLTTAARADAILYLKAGEVVEQGSHKELMQANGEYAALFRVFSGGVLDGQLV